MKVRRFAGAVLLSLAVASAAGGARLDLALSRSELTVGDRVELDLVLGGLEVEPLALPEFPRWRQEWGELEILEVGKVERIEGNGSGTTTYRQRVVATAFQTGEIPLPEVAVRIALPTGYRTLTSPGDLRLVVRSVLPEDRQGVEPRPPTPPRSLPLGVRFWASCGTLGVLCLFASVALEKRLQRRRTALVRLPRTPLQELLDELTRLKNRPDLEEGHTGLSQALRRFLDRTLEVHTLEQTTREIRRSLARLGLPAPWIEETGTLLHDCDLIRFAATPATRTDFAKRLTRARNLAQSLARRVQTPGRGEGA